MSSFATSYIPTVASQVTRTADQASITGANFSQFYNQDAGTFVVDFDVLSTTSTSKVTFATHDGTSSNTNNSYVLNGGTVFAEVRSGGLSQAALNLGSATANTVFKSAFAYSSNDFAGSGNGGTVATDTSGAVALSQNVLNIGHAIMYGGLYLNGHIRSIRYYPTRLTNAQIQALTA